MTVLAAIRALIYFTHPSPLQPEHTMSDSRSLVDRVKEEVSVLREQSPSEVYSLSTPAH
jgi:hypothetical protein